MSGCPPHPAYAPHPCCSPGACDREVGSCDRNPEPSCRPGRCGAHEVVLCPEEEAQVDRIVAEDLPEEVLAFMEQSDCMRSKMYNYTRLAWRSATEYVKTRGGHCAPKD